MDELGLEIERALERALNERLLAESMNRRNDGFVEARLRAKQPLDALRELHLRDVVGEMIKDRRLVLVGERPALLHLG